MKKLIRPEFFLALLCILFFAAGLASLNTMVVYTPDSARYLIWANSLAKFSGFEDSSAPELSRYVVHGPLYSVMLAPSQMIFPIVLKQEKLQHFSSAFWPSLSYLSGSKRKHPVGTLFSDVLSLQRIR